MDSNSSVATDESGMTVDSENVKRSAIHSTSGPATSTRKTPAKQNVMVLSWLTPTNNEGRFMFSIHKSRYSASLIAPYEPSNHNTDEKKLGVEFSLCVPIKGMEQLVLNVGSISGRYGCKFQSSSSNESKEVSYTDDEQLSNRKRKKLKQEKLSRHGVPGLVKVSLGCSDPSESLTTANSSDIFAIQGTVAHLHCRTYGVVLNSPLEHQSHSVDEDHWIILAEVIDAYVQPSYWDSNKLLFCPQGNETEVPPCLTFFGSQTLGYVTVPSSK